MTKTDLASEATCLKACGSSPVYREIKYMKWHKYQDEEPDAYSGSYLILTHFNEIAEAEYRRDGWFQYRWSSYIGCDAVKAWCSFKEIERPEMDSK